jgi:hypothetical protein
VSDNPTLRRLIDAAVLSSDPPAGLVADLASSLDGLDHPARLAAVRSLPGRSLARLFECVESEAIDLDHFVPAGLGDGIPVRHLGVNSLPLFRQFEKRFVRAPGSDLLWGYNHQAMGWLTGPGYFAVPAIAAGESLCIDYNSVPDCRPVENWPAPRGNEGFPDRFVYGFMRDHMRRVSRHVSIGRAEKKGRLLDTWFALVRMDRPEGSRS